MGRQVIAAISLMRRREDVPLPQFRRHWLDVHGPLVCGFPALRRYVQCHVLASPLTTERALAMRVDGFPILYFDNDADRLKAHGSAAMAECNIDSRLFIGAVARVISDVEEIVPRAASAGRISLILLDPADPAALAHSPRLRGLVRYHVREQGPAPSSTIPHLSVQVAGIAQAWFDSVVELEEAAAAWNDTSAGLFVVEEHWLDPLA
jgi:uncharacterized protein (TIGR02118 family)